MHKSLEKSLVEPDLKSKEWHDSFKQAQASGDAATVSNLAGKSQITEVNETIQDIIKEFTISTRTRKGITELSKKLVLNHGAQNVEIDGDNLKVTIDDLVVDVYRFAETWAGMDKKLPVLKTGEREGECRALSLLVSNLIAREGVENNVVTGRIHQLADKCDYLHTWVEFDEDGKTFVVDATMNAIVNQDGYYRFNNVGKVGKVSSSTIKNETKILDELLAYDELLGTLYLTDHDKAIKIYNKQVKGGQEMQ